MKLKLTILIVLLGSILSINAQSLPSNLPKFGIIGWWPFNGNANDESGNKHHGKVNGASLTTDRFGNINRAYNFDGINDFINVDTLKFNSFSICGWYKISDMPTAYTPTGCNWNYTFVSNLHHNSSLNVTKGVEIRYQNPGALGTQTGDGSLPWDGDTINTTFGGWKFFALTYNSSNQTFILYNGLKDTSIIKGGFSNLNLPTYFGARPICGNAGNSGFYLKGNLDDIGIWDRALTQSEINAVFTNGTKPCDLIKKSCFSVEPKNKTSLLLEPAMSYTNTNKFQRSLSKFEVPTGVWTHVAIVKKDTSIYLYKNGTFIDSTSYLKGFSYSWSKLILGASYYTGYIRYFKGQMDDIRYSDQVRNASEIYSNYISNQPAKTDSKTKGLWNLDTISKTGNFGATTGTSGTSSNVTNKTGKYGNSFYFDGMKSHADISNSISTINNTLEFWINPDTLQESWPIAYYGANSAGIMFAPKTQRVIYKWSTGDTGITTCVNPNNFKFISVTDGNCEDTIFFGWKKETITHIDTITVNITDTTHISVTDTLFINVTFNSVSGTKSNIVKMYPNPTNTELTIDFNNYNDILGYSIEIYNQTGQRVYNSTVSQKTVTQNLSNWLGKGIYYVKISDKSGNAMDIKKIILQ